MHADHLLKIKEEFGNLKKQEIPTIFTKMKDFKDLKRRTFSDKVLRDKQSILLKILNMMDIKEDLLLLFIDFLTKCLKVVMLLIMRLNKI